MWVLRALCQMKWDNRLGLGLGSEGLWGLSQTLIELNSGKRPRHEWKMRLEAWSLGSKLEW